MAELKRTDTAIQIKKIGMRKAELKFVQPAVDPLRGIELNGTPEQNAETEVKAVKSGFAQRAAQEQERFQQTTRTDYYFAVVFEDGGQANAFLKAVGYPTADALFVDGTILADILKIEIPQAEFKLRPLKAPDAKLARLVTSAPRRIGK